MGLGKVLRPARRWMSKRGLHTVMLKNPDRPGFAGLTVNWHQPDPRQMLRCSLVPVVCHGESADFLIYDEDDHIQKELKKGRLYEPEELAIIAK